MRTDGFSISTCLPASRAARAAAKCRLSGVAMQTKSTGAWLPLLVLPVPASNCSIDCGSVKLTKSAMRPAERRRYSSARLPVRLATAASSTRHDAEGRIVEGPLVNRLEEGAIRFVKDHPQPDHCRPRSVEVAV